MPWKGTLMRTPLFSMSAWCERISLPSVHVDEYTLEVRETKRGFEELTGVISRMLMRRLRRISMPVVLCG